MWKESGVEHGLIASLVDLNTGIRWVATAYQTTTVPGGATSPTDGLVNSNAIVAMAGASNTYAAGLCRAYSAAGDGGLNDWYLPAIWELNECYNSVFVVNTNLGVTNGCQASYYWSTTEDYYANTYAYIWSFDSGQTTYFLKTDPARVRAVRTF